MTNLALMSALAVAALSPAVGEQTQGDTSSRVTDPPTPSTGIRSGDALRGQVDRMFTAIDTDEVGRVGRNLLGSWIYGSNGIIEMTDKTAQAAALKENIANFCDALTKAGDEFIKTLTVDPSIHAKINGRNVNGPAACRAALGEDKILRRLITR